MLDPACITRNILADKPRVTRFPIDWNAAPGDAGTVAAEGGVGGGGLEDDEMGVGEENAGGEAMAAGEDNGGAEAEVRWEMEWNVASDLLGVLLTLWAPQ